jgi:glycosyltransferase involved in cell wall biosynthesis
VTPATVLHVIASLGLGGAERQLALLLRLLDRRRFRPLVVCTTGGGPLLPEVEAAGVPVTVFGKRARVDPVLVWRLAAFIRRERPDLVHTWMFTANTWGRLAAVLARAPAIVASERCVDLWKGPVHAGVDRLLARSSRRVLANSEAVARFLVARERLPESKVRVVRNGLDPLDAERLRPRPPAEIERLRSALGVPPGAPVVGDVARLDPKNGLLFWVHVVQRLAARHPGLVALLAGGAASRTERRYARRVEDAIRRHGLGDRVRLLGVRRDLEAVLPALDVFLHASTMEGFPNSVMEAMAAGIPVVATRAGGTPELVLDGETGCLAGVGDVAALAGHALDLLADPARRARMGEAGARRVRDLCGHGRMVSAIEAVYDEVLRESRGWT